MTQRKLTSHPKFLQNLHSVRQAPKRTIAGIAIILMSGLLGGVVLHQQNAQSWAIQVTRDIAVGDRIRANDVVKIAIPITSAQSPWIGNPEDVVNSSAVHSLPEGALIAPADVSEVVDGRVRLAASFDVSEVPAGVDVGDQVDLWVTTPELGNARKIATDATVLALNAEVAPGKLVTTVRVLPESVIAILNAGNQLRLTMAK